MKNILLGLVTLSFYIVKAHPIAPHPAVVAVRHEEEQLPIHLRKPAIFNPHLHEILSLTSLLHHGENLVIDREADKISRQAIYKILTHAGFLKRQQQGQLPTHLYVQSYAPGFDTKYLYQPELLQYL